MRILNQKWYGPCNPSAPELTAFDTALATRVNGPEEVVWPANIEPINLSQRKWDDTQKMEFKRCHVETLRLICESTSWTGKCTIAEQSNAKEAFFSADLWVGQSPFGSIALPPLRHRSQFYVDHIEICHWFGNLGSKRPGSLLLSFVFLRLWSLLLRRLLWLLIFNLAMFGRLCRPDLRLGLGSRFGLGCFQHGPRRLQGGVYLYKYYLFFWSIKWGRPGDDIRIKTRAIQLGGWLLDLVDLHTCTSTP